MKTKTLTLLVAGTSLLLCANWANAQVFLNENFDSYADQAAFTTVWNISGTAADTLNTEQSKSPSQSVKALTTATRSAKSIGEVGFLNASTDIVKFKFDFYDSAGAASAYRQYGEITDGTAPTSSGQLYAMGLNNNIVSTYYMARVLGADGGQGVSAFFKLDGTGVPTRSTGWHTLEADISDIDVKFYVDGNFSKAINTSAFTDRSLDVVRLGSNLTSTQVAYFDNVSVERVIVPEPSSVALAVLGGLALAVGTISRRKI
jgi:hypothetical protein